MDWLARPPNMKPIHHVWDCLQRRIATSNVQCWTREIAHAFWKHVCNQTTTISREIAHARPTGTINLSQLRDVTKALPGKLPVQIKFRLFPIDCDVRDVLF